MIPTCEISFSETIHAIPKILCGLESRTGVLFRIEIRIIVATHCSIEILCETVHAARVEMAGSRGQTSRRWFSKTIHAIPKILYALESRTGELFVIEIRIIVATDCSIEILCETVHATNTEFPASDGKLGDDCSRSIFMRF